MTAIGKTVIGAMHSMFQLMLGSADRIGTAMTVIGKTVIGAMHSMFQIMLG